MLKIACVIFLLVVSVPPARKFVWDVVRTFVALLVIVVIFWPIQSRTLAGAPKEV